MRQYFLDALKEAPEGEDRVFPEIHEETPTQKFVQDLAKHAGITLWPKPFQNMRSTCATVLLEVFPPHVVNDWLGHTEPVADKYYRQVTANHFDKATGKSTSNEIIPDMHTGEFSASNVCGQICGVHDIIDDYSRSEAMLVNQIIQKMNQATKAAFIDEYGAQPTLCNLNRFYLTQDDLLCYTTNDTFYGDWEVYESYCAKAGIQPQVFKYKYLESSNCKKKDSQGGTRTRTPNGQGILNPQRLPFRHSAKKYS